MRALAGAILIAATVIAYQMGEYESVLLEFIAVACGLILIVGDFLPEIRKLIGWLTQARSE